MHLCGVRYWCEVLLKKFTIKRYVYWCGCKATKRPFWLYWKYMKYGFKKSMYENHQRSHNWNWYQSPQNVCHMIYVSTYKITNLLCGGLGHRIPLIFVLCGNFYLNVTQFSYNIYFFFISTQNRLFNKFWIPLLQRKYYSSKAHFAHSSRHGNRTGRRRVLSPQFPIPTL